MIFFPLRSALAIDLVEAYLKAKTHDPEYLASLHEYRAAQTLTDQSLSRVLPQVGFSYSISNYRFIKDRGIYSDYSAEQNNLSLRQAIFDLPSLIDIKQAEDRVKAALARFKNSEQNLIRRLSEAYFDYLFAEQNLKVLEEEKKAYEAQLEMVKKLFQAGETTLTDVHDAEARLYDVLFRITEAQKLFYSKKRNLARIIGQEPDKLASLSEKLDEVKLIPDSVEGWIEIAKSENPFIRFYLIQRDISESELRKQKSQWLPSLSLFSGYTRTNTRDFLEVKPLSYVTVGLQLNWNLFTGGYVSSKIKEAQERLLQAEKEYEKALSDVSQGVVESYYGLKTSYAGILSAISQVRASELSLVSTKKGYEAGIRTFVDILNAEASLYRARANLIRSSYEYLKGIVNLYFYAGILSEEHVALINSKLTRAD